MSLLTFYAQFKTVKLVMETHDFLKYYNNKKTIQDFHPHKAAEVMRRFDKATVCKMNMETCFAFGSHDKIF